MGPKVLELKTNTSLLNSNFNGYKLSLDQIPTIKQELSNSVYRQVPNVYQYSLLHTKLFALHNHLIGENCDGIESVYFADKEWSVKKFYVDPLSAQLTDATLWKIPTKSRPQGAYNVSIKLCTDKLAIVADGLGSLYVLDRGTKNNDDPWLLLFTGEVIGPDKNFLITDAVTKDEKLHILLIRIEQENSKCATKLNWVTLSQIDGNWGQIALRELEVIGYVQYANFERNCEAVYVVSDNACKFTLDSENEIKREQDQSDEINKYTWSQTREEITIKFPVTATDLNQIYVKTENLTIDVRVDDEILLKGDLYSPIDGDLTIWMLKKGILQINLQKGDFGFIWSEIVEGDQSGEYELDPSLGEGVADNLAHLTSTNESHPPAGTTFNSQQVEECDFECDKFTVFERLSLNHDVTHKINLGSHQVLCTVQMELGAPLALGLRADVDTCIWQPHSDDLMVDHKGTLLAIGYIQASKQQKKFLICPPDLSYSAICETSTHVFIYRQKRCISSGELRNRTTGQTVETVAQQQVVHLKSNEEILGAYAANTCLFLLGESFIMVLQF